MRKKLTHCLFGCIIALWFLLGRFGPLQAIVLRTVSEVRIRENESLESALKRFKRQCARSGVLQEVRKREHYEKPSVKRKKKAEAARKRKW